MWLLGKTLTHSQLATLLAEGAKNQMDCVTHDNLDPWLNRTHGKIDYFLTQGGFQSYLSKIGKARSSDCVFCNGVADDSEHTFFSCERLDGFHKQLYVDTGKLSADNIIREMLKKIEFDRGKDPMARGSLN